MSFTVPNKHRERQHPLLKTDASAGQNGCFVIPHHRILGYNYVVIASDGNGWEHVSVQVSPARKKASRCPTWEEMCFIKGLFWDADDCVVQYHPAAKDYVNNHPFVLHLWRPTDAVMPAPPAEMVGIKKEEE